MKKVKVITDSTMIAEPELIKELAIDIVPLGVMIDGVLYSDDQLPGEEFMELMSKAKALPSTSQPPIGLFVETFDKYPADEYDVISINITKNLSGTAEAARQAAQISHANVTVVDSEFINQSMSFQVIEAAKMARDGFGKEEILVKLEKIRANTKLYLGLSTLENVVKGGRIGKASGMIASVLNIKVIMEFTPELHLQPIVKGRGVKTFTKWRAQLVEMLKATPNVAAIGISYAGNKALALDFLHDIQPLFKDMHIPLLHTGSVIAMHTGDGAFAIEYYTD